MKMLLLESYGLQNILRIKWDQFMFVVVSIRQNLNIPTQMLVKNSLNLYHLDHFQEMVPLMHSTQVFC